MKLEAEEIIVKNGTVLYSALEIGLTFIQAAILPEHGGNTSIDGSLVYLNRDNFSINEKFVFDVLSWASRFEYHGKNHPSSANASKERAVAFARIFNEIIEGRCKCEECIGD